MANPIISSDVFNAPNYSAMLTPVRDMVNTVSKNASKPVAIKNPAQEVTDEDLDLIQMAMDKGLSKEEAFKKVKDFKAMKATQTTPYDPLEGVPEAPKQQKSAPVFQDAHADENVFEQSAKAIPRAIGDTASGIWKGAEQATTGAMNALSSTATAGINSVFGSNLKAPVAETPEEILDRGFDSKTPDKPMPSLAKSLSDIPAGASTAAFNIAKAPVAIGINTASELPGTQYITQGIGKGLDLGADAIASTGVVDKDTASNLVTTGMNTLGLRMKGGNTTDAVNNAKTAFKEGAANSDHLYGGIPQAATSLAKDTLKSTVDIAKIPVDIVKGAVSLPIKATKSLLGRKPTETMTDTNAITPSGENVSVTEPSVMSNVKDTVFSTKDNVDLATRAVFPNMTKEKSGDAKKNAGQIALNGVEQIYNDARTGKIESDINTMKGGVDGMSEGMEYWGKKIGDLTKSDAPMEVGDLVTNLDNALKNPLTKVNSELYNLANNISSIFKETGGKLSIENAQRAMSNIKSEIFNNAETVKKLYKTDAGKALLDFIDGFGARFDKTIEESTGNLPELTDAKGAYARYAKIQKDFLRSFLANERNSKTGISGTAGTLVGLYELIKNPTLSGITTSIITKLIMDEVGHAKTRGGAYETLIRNLDRDAVKRSKGTIKPPKHDSRNTSSNNSPLAHPKGTTIKPAESKK